MSIGFDGLVEKYIGFNEKALHGEYWRFVTTIFVHDIPHHQHIFGNSLGLLAFGTLSERYFGKRNYILVYMTAGLLAPVYDIVAYCGLDILIDVNVNNCDPSGYVDYGASGCVFGLVGALLVYALTNKKDLFGSSIRSKLLYGTSMSIYIVGALIVSHGLFSDNLLDVLWGFSSPASGFMEHVHGGAFIIGIILGFLIVTLRLIKAR